MPQLSSNPYDQLSNLSPEMFYIPNTSDVDNAFNTIDKVTGKIGNVLSMIDYVIREADERTSVSLINYIKASQVASTMFIEDRIAHEDILKDLIINIYNIYTGFIMTAVQLNTAISNSKTVKDAFSIVATGESLDYSDYSPIQNQLELLNPLLQISNETANKEHDKEPEDKDYSIKKNYTDEKIEKNDIVNNQSDKIYIPTGRTLQLKFKTHWGKDIDLMMNLILYPVFVPSLIFQSFVKFQYPRNTKDRWMQWKAGEISFFKDFVFEMDLRKEQRKAKKQDKTNILAQMFAERNGNNLSQMRKVSTNNNRQNIANTILIVDHDNFTRACKQAHINFSNPSDRAKFFSTSMSLMLAAIDPSLSQIHMYYNGLDKQGTYTFNQMKQNSKSEKTDILDIMKAFSQGIAPRI
jgi:hypothetical protein